MATLSSEPASTGMLTLKYASAVVSALIATYGALELISELFGLWTDKMSGVALFSGYVGIVTMAVMTALFSVLAFLLFRRVTKDIAVQPEYVTTPIYSFITNGFFAVIATVFVVVISQLVAILVSSLLLIGTSTDIGALYLAEFLPGLLAAGVLGFAGFAAYKIMKGTNFSALLTLVLMGLAGVLLVAVLITVPIKAHTTTTSSSSSSMYDYSKYLNQFYNSGN